MAVENREKEVYQLQNSYCLRRSTFVGRFWQAALWGTVGAALGAGGEALRQTQSYSTDGQTRREILGSLNLKNIFKAASIGGSTGFTISLVGSRKVVPE